MPHFDELISDVFTHYERSTTIAKDCRSVLSGDTNGAAILKDLKDATAFYGVERVSLISILARAE